MASLRDRVKASKGELAQPLDTDAAAFIDGANETQNTNTDIERPWEEFDKKAVPRTTFNLRLNDYELTLLRWLAEQREESMQRVAKRLLIPLLEQLAHEKQVKL